VLSKSLPGLRKFGVADSKNLQNASLNRIASAGMDHFASLNIARTSRLHKEVARQPVCVPGFRGSA
jgi:hypothetical protein